MIKSFKCKNTQSLWETGSTSKFPPDIQQKAIVKLRSLYAAININELKIPPSNRLEKLQGNRKEQYSIRINKQWRICFKWKDTDAYDIEIIDYH